MYIVYDGRAMYDTDEASIYTTAETLDEARADALDYGEGVIYSYKVGKGNVLEDERFEEYVNDHE